jgi:GNAT superfamily N-acetyltransferase
MKKLASLMEFEPDEILRVWNDAARFDRLTPGLLQEKLANDKDWDEHLALGIRDGKQLAGWAVGVVRDVGDERRGYVKMLAVRPDSQRQGIGRQLLQCLEQRLIDAGAARIRVAESAPNYLTPGVDVRYSPAERLLESAGYQRFGETFNLRAQLSGRAFSPPVAIGSEGVSPIEVRPGEAADLGATLKLLAAHWPAWFGEVRQAFAHAAPRIFLAWQSGEVVGFAAYDSNNFNTGWFGPMGTAPQARGQGVGAALLQHALVALAEQGHPTATIPWVGPVEFYARHCGAQLERTFHRYEKITAR